jgi:mersacidin/lichenicidin family type 2 lantibiotic
MSHINIIRALRDEEYFLSLSPSERAAIPAHPAGSVELSDADLEAVAGGMRPNTSDSAVMSPDICCCR